MRRTRTGLIAIAAIMLGLLAGVGAASGDVGGRVEKVFALIPGPGGASAILLAAIALFGMTRSPFLPLGALIAWLPAQDLIRKLFGNDPRILLVQDAILVMALASLARPLARSGAFRESFSGWRRPLAIFLAWQFVMSVAVAFVDWRLPLLAWRLGFAFLPFVAIGWLIAQDDARFRRAMRVLGIVLAVPCLIGIAQSVIGPEFLAPTREIAEFTHLELYRGARGQGAVVFRPSGPFTEPSRYANWCLVTLVAGLCAYQAASSRRRGAVALVGIGGLGLFVSGGRAALLVGIVVTAPVVLRAAARGARGLQSAAGIAIALAVGLLVFSNLYGEDFESRATYYTETLATSGQGAELAERIALSVENTVHGFEAGGLFGRGAGTQSNGRQYLYAATEPPAVARNEVEGGWASLAVELGAIGLALWLWWTWAWRRRLKALRRDLSTTPFVGAASTVMWTWTAVLFGAFLLTLGLFQDYVMNAWLWGSSGVIAGLAHRARSERTSKSLSPGDAETVLVRA